MFVEPKIEVAKFAIEDVITESAGGAEETTIPALVPPCL